MRGDFWRRPLEAVAVGNFEEEAFVTAPPCGAPLRLGCVSTCVLLPCGLLCLLTLRDSIY